MLRWVSPNPEGFGNGSVAQKPVQKKKKGHKQLNTELEVLTGEWLQEGNDLQSDLYDDDFIDFADFSIFAREWFWKGGWYE